MARMYENGSQIGAASVVNIIQASGVFDANSVAHYQRANLWPQWVAPYSVTYQDTLTLNTPLTWTPFGERSSSSNVNVSSRVTNFIYTTGPSQTSHRLYLGYKFKNTNSDGPNNVATYYHDMTYVAVQIVRNTTIWNEWKNTSWTQWQTTTLSRTDPLAYNPNQLSYANISAGTLSNRWNQDVSGTSSSHTGIFNGYNGSGVYPVALSGAGNSLLPTTGAAYCYVETSGAGNNQTYWMRSPFFNLNANTLYSFRIAHYLNTSSNYSTDTQAFQDVCGIMIGT